MEIGRTQPQREGNATVQIELSPELIGVFDAFVSDRNDFSREEAIMFALREWATDRGLIPAEPTAAVPLANLNARNDG